MREHRIHLRRLIHTLSLAFIFWLAFSADLSAQSVAGDGVLNIGTRLELFTDRQLIESMEGAAIVMHHPVQREIVLRFDKPWEGKFCGYPTVIKDGDLYLIYYRGMPSAGADGSSIEVTCYAFSFDGVNWTKPALGLYEIFGTRDNNVILYNDPPFSHNFAPFLDAKAGIPKEERFKALAGTESTGLVPFVSPDGIHWKKFREKAVILDGKFDSQNVAFWSESEGCYVCYFRTWSEGGWQGFRTISRSTSADFITWSPPEAMTFGKTPMEHLYTNQTTPYFRAPHLYIALPMRFMPGRKVLSDEQARQLAVHVGEVRKNYDYSNDCAEVAFMSSRGGTNYDRTFMEGFIRPGLDPGNWASRTGMVACGIVPTGTEEISIYKQHHYAQPSAHLVRYALRTDGFASLNAPFAGGEIITRPLRFAGNRLVMNFSTGASGGIRTEILDESGKPCQDFSLDLSDEIIGDAIERTVTWQGRYDVGSLTGKTIRLRFLLKDADIYSIRFAD